MRVVPSQLSRRALVLGPFLLLLPNDAKARRRWGGGGGSRSPFALVIGGVLVCAILVANSVFGRRPASKRDRQAASVAGGRGGIHQIQSDQRAAAPRRGLSPWVFVLPLAGIVIGGAYGWATVPPDTITASFSFCNGQAHDTCVVDGDTFWLEGVKYRIADIDTPEIGEPRCQEELALGETAKYRLLALLNEGPFGMESGFRDEDKYGRKLRTIYRGGRSLGDILVEEGLARTWTGQRLPWC